MRKQITFFTIVVLVAFAALAAAQDNPCNPCAKKTLNPCNPCSKAMEGHVFYIADPMNRNSATFTSNAPLEDIVGVTNQLSGKIMFDPANPAVAMGEVMVPVASISSGIPLRDEHLRSEAWLNASQYPNITFSFDKVTDVKVIKKAESSVTYEAKLHGVLDLHGKTKEIVVPARFTYMPESEKTKMRAPGDLVAGNAKFTVSLDDFGVKGMQGIVGNRVAEDVDVEVRFVANNVMQGGDNPCNPCAKNPCNPCAKEKK